MKMKTCINIYIFTYTVHGHVLVGGHIHVNVHVRVHVHVHVHAHAHILLHVDVHEQGHHTKRTPGKICPRIKAHDATEFMRRLFFQRRKDLLCLLCWLSVLCGPRNTFYINIFIKVLSSIGCINLASTSTNVITFVPFHK
jgi:hypothetical protein